MEALEGAHTEAAIREMLNWFEGRDDNRLDVKSWSRKLPDLAPTRMDTYMYHSAQRKSRCWPAPPSEFPQD
jgi:hypothetical protein